MTSLLFVTSSLSGAASKSSELAEEFIAASYPGAPRVHRDLQAEAMPHLSPQTLGALMRPEAERDDDQKALVAFADTLIAEVEKADVIVIAAPMYNFSIPSTLKAWIDHVARAGRTFRYTETGPQGLLGGKKVFVISARGGKHSGTPRDFVETYLRTVLGFIGLTDVTFVNVEGLAMGPDAATQGLAAARSQIADLSFAMKAAA
jgi:FMN-dependent NADH-azoreductase